MQGGLRRNHSPRLARKERHQELVPDALHRRHPQVCKAPHKALSLTSARTHGNGGNRVAGFGRDWQHSHLLARGQIIVPAGLREAVMPGLVGLLLELLSDATAGRLLPTLQAISWLVDVFVSDMPLKLRRYGKSWATLFPREVSVALVTGHPQWAKFCIDIMVQDDLAKQRMKNNRDFKGSPVEVCKELSRLPVTSTM